MFLVLSNDSQLISIKNLQAATSYRIQIAVRSQAGQSIFSSPVKPQTLEGAAPNFTLLNNSCTDSTSCLIKWHLKNDEGSSISKAEISYTKVNRFVVSRKSLVCFFSKINRKGEEKNWVKDISIDSQLTEYELTRLKPNTNYSIRVRLFNEAGPSEQKIQKTTSKFGFFLIDYFLNFVEINLLAGNSRSGSSSGINTVIISLIIISIILGGVGCFVLLIWSRRKSSPAEDE